MANPSEFLRRSLTSIAIVAFTILPVIYSPWTLLGWLCIIHFFCLKEFLRLHHSPVVMDYVITGLLTCWLAVAGWLTMRFDADYFSLALLPALLAILMLLMMIKNADVNGIQRLGLHLLAGTAYISLALWTGTLLLSKTYEFKLLLIPIFLIWMNDTGAYLIGSKWGKRKIAPAISPGKTIEGTIGGAILTLLLAFILTLIWPSINVRYIWFLGLLTPIFALAGDLWESALKRSAQVKDSGQFLPGHGGMLDRYDSFLFVLPVSVLGYFIFVA